MADLISVFLKLQHYNHTIPLSQSLHSSRQYSIRFDKRIKERFQAIGLLKTKHLQALKELYQILQTLN